MGIIVSLMLIICGGFACYQQIVARKPEAGQLLDAIAPYKGYIGLAALVWGLVASLHAISIIAAFGFWWLVYLASGLCSVKLGFLLSFDLLQQYLLKGNAQAEEKAARVRVKLEAKQTPLGYVAIGLGVLGLLLNIAY